MTASREKGINSAQQVGDFWRWLLRSEWSRRQAEAADRSRSFSQLFLKLLNACRQQFCMDLRMNRVCMAKVSGCEYNRFLVEEFIGRNSGVRSGEAHRVGKSCMHEVRQDSPSIPTCESGPAKIDEIDLDPLPYNVLCESFKNDSFVCS